jgi:hypothetical protein
LSTAGKNVAFYLHTCGPAGDAFRYVTTEAIAAELGYSRRAVQVALDQLVRGLWIAPGAWGVGNGGHGVSLWWLLWKLPEEVGDLDREEPARDDVDDGPFALGGGGAP